MPADMSGQEFNRGGPEPKRDIEPSLSKLSFQEVQGRLRGMANKKVDPGHPKVIELQNARQALVDRAKKFEVFDNLKEKIANIQSRVGTRAYGYHEVIQEITNLAPYAANEENTAKGSSVTDDKGQVVDKWDSQLDGIALEYVEGARRVTEFIYADLHARLEPDPNLKDTWGNYAKDIKQRIQLLNWGDIPEDDVYPLMIQVVEKEIEEGNKKNLRRQSVRSRSAAEQKIFGEGFAFSARWTRKHLLPEVIRPNVQMGINKSFSPAELLSRIFDTGVVSQPQLYQLAAVLDSSGEMDFETAATNGLISILRVNHAMGSGRIDTVAATLKEGPTPQGIAQWLTVDDETRQALSVLFELSGYKVAGGIMTPVEETQKISTPKKPAGERAQGELNKYFSELTENQINDRLKWIQQTLKTDWGIVMTAYTIFRILGFPHGNAKFAGDLVKKYQFDPEAKKGDIEASDIAPFIERFPDPRAEQRGRKDYYLKDVLRDEGMQGFAEALNNLPAEKLAREWSDLQLILDAMDKIGDIRKGVGGSAALGPEKRLQAIYGVQELQIALAKRKFDKKTTDRIFDPKKVEQAPAAAEPSFWERTIYGMKMPLSGLKQKPTVRGEKRQKKG